MGIKHRAEIPLRRKLRIRPAKFETTILFYVRPSLSYLVLQSLLLNDVQRCSKKLWRWKESRWTIAASSNSIKKIEWNAKQVWMRLTALRKGDSKKIVSVLRQKAQTLELSRFPHKRSNGFLLMCRVHTWKYYFLRFQLPTLSFLPCCNKESIEPGLKYTKGCTRSETRLEFSWWWGLLLVWISLIS